MQIICLGYIVPSILYQDKDSSSHLAVQYSSIPKYNWDVHERCKYGMMCGKLQSFEHENMNLVLSIEPLITGLLVNGTKAQLQQLLQLLRGEFSAVYSQVERDWYYSHQD